MITAALANAETGQWKIIRVPQWGFLYQLPVMAVRQHLSTKPSGTCDMYISGGLACVMQVNPTSSDALASTAIEQTIQADLKLASKIGPASRWESTSKNGDLFKGYTGPVVLNKSDATQAAVIQAIGASKAVQSVAMAPLGDESAPMLKIVVIGTPDKEKEVVGLAKDIASLVVVDKKPVSEGPAPAPKPAPTPAATPKPAVKAAVKPWPALKAGEIELMGVVDSVSKDGKTVMMTIYTVKVMNQEPVELQPSRAKKVLIERKQGWIAPGTFVRIVGPNSGEGKPIKAKRIEESPLPPGKPAPPIPPDVS